MNDLEQFVITPDDYKINRDKIADIINNRGYNKKIMDYYRRYFCNPDRGLMLSFHKVENMSKCNKMFLVDRYDQEMIKEIRKTNLCKDKFCSNCKKVKQATRMSRYIPSIEPYREYAYHLVLTIPSVVGEDLRSTIDDMNRSFNRLIRYFDGRLKLRGIDFKKYGYLGAIKSLEITFKGNSYHPHFHVLLVLKSRGEEDSCYLNDYSYSTSNGFRKFTSLEILIQKVWCLLMNNVEVNEKNINDLVQGYSCVLDKFKDDDYAELFKYLTKDFDDSKNILTYDNFVSILEATYKLKQIQGYGCFYKLIDENLDEEFEKEYDSVIKFLNLLEKPCRTSESPEKLLNDPYTLISRKKLWQYLNRDE